MTTVLPGLPGSAPSYAFPAKNPDPFLDLDRVIPSIQAKLPITGLVLTVFALPSSVVEELFDRLLEPETLALLKRDEKGGLDTAAIARRAWDLVDVLVPAALNADYTAGHNARRLPIQDGMELVAAILLASFPGGIGDFLDYARKRMAELGIEFSVATSSDETTSDADATGTTTPTPGTSTTPTSDEIGSPTGIDLDAPIHVSSIRPASS